MSKSASAASNTTMINSFGLNTDIEDDDECVNNNNNNNNNKNDRNNTNTTNSIGLRTSSSLFSPWMPTSNTSLAAEVYSTLARDYRSKNSTL